MTRVCPQGHGAFEEPALRCPLCGAPLEAAPVRRPGDRGKPMRVAVAPNEPIAGLWRSVLDEAGIVSMIHPLGPGFGAWGSVATFEHEVMVPEADLDDARALLAGFEAMSDGDEMADDETTDD